MFDRDTDQRAEMKNRWLGMEHYRLQCVELHSRIVLTRGPRVRRFGPQWSPSRVKHDLSPAFSDFLDGQIARLARDS